MHRAAGGGMRRHTVLAAALLVVVVAGTRWGSVAQRTATVVDPDYGGTASCSGSGTVEEFISGGGNGARNRGRELAVAGSGYIGYNALQKDRTPCSVRGASYGNCNPGGAANPYSRGCSAIARCRG